MNEANTGERVFSFDEITRNLTGDEIARIKAGELTEEEAKNPLFQRARTAWSVECEALVR